jgi:hypothetical protein
MNNAVGRAAAVGFAWLREVRVDAQTDEIEVYDGTINAPGTSFQGLGALDFARAAGGL